MYRLALAGAMVAVMQLGLSVAIAADAARSSTGTGRGQAAPPAARQAVLDDWSSQYTELLALIKSGGNLYPVTPDIPYAPKPRRDPYMSIASLGNADSEHVYDAQARILDTDKHPLDIVLRRTRSLIRYLSSSGRATAFAAEEASLARIEQAAATGDEAVRRALFLEVCAIRRKIAFANPIVGSMNQLVMMNRHWSGENMGAFPVIVAPGGSAYLVRNPFSDAPHVTDLLDRPINSGRYKGIKPAGGAVLGLEVSFDAKRLLFSWCRGEAKINSFDPEHVYHIFRLDLESGTLDPLTDGPFHDMDACELPNGRIAFVSCRRATDKLVALYPRCGFGTHTWTLYDMAADGSDITPWSFHDLPESSPSVDFDGRVVYSRWDYYDRISHHHGNLWICDPDGCNPRAPHGNYMQPLQTIKMDDGNSIGGQYFGGRGVPMMEFDIRAIPGKPGQYTAAAGSVDGGWNVGTLVHIDLRIPDDGRLSQVRRITPHVGFPESEIGALVDGSKRAFTHCWPLDADVFLCTYTPNLYYLDRFGNRELIIGLKEATAQQRGYLADPIPVQPRPVPPVIPTKTFQGVRATLPHKPATVTVINVYQSDFSWPPDTKIKWLRIIQIFPKTATDQVLLATKNPICPAPGGAETDPGVGYGLGTNCRMPLGIVPVEEDGSAHFAAPTNKSIYFQALDERGMAVQSMRSATYVHAGEQLACVGCHEGTHRAPAPGRSPLALQREPSSITPEVSSGAMPFNFHILAKPVLQNTCAPCHAAVTAANQERSGPTDMNYGQLRPYAFYFDSWKADLGRQMVGGSRTLVGRFGARESRMGKALLNPTHQKAMKEGKITVDDFRRIVLWLDCNSAELGAYQGADQQREGKIVWPMIDVDPQNPQGR